MQTCSFDTIFSPKIYGVWPQLQAKAFPLALPVQNFTRLHEQVPIPFKPLG